MLFTMTFLNIWTQCRAIVDLLLDADSDRTPKSTRLFNLTAQRNNSA